MTTLSRDLTCSPESVFDVLADGWLYASWVVGASRIRDVDDSWPAEGARLHHSVGLWPILIDDVTVVKEYDPPRRFLLQAKAWPSGEATVELRIEATSGGCRVVMTEDATRGPATMIPRPLRAAMLRPRNRETLQRLALLAEGGAGERQSGPHTG